MARQVVSALFGVMVLSGIVHASGGVWMDVVAKIESKLREALAEYQRGEKFDAVELVVDAYFGIFEAPEANMEVAVRRFISFKEALRLEKGFTELRKAMHKETAPARVEAQVIELVEMLKDAAARLERKGVTPDALAP